MNPGFIKSFLASAAIDPYRIVAFSDAGNSSQVAVASAGTDVIIGVSDSLGADAGGMADIIMSDVGEVQLGATLPAGALVTANAEGKAVQATAASGSVVRAVGMILEPGVANDIVPIFILPTVLDAPS